MAIWTEHRNAEGRTYWFNTGTKESVWEKPDDLKSPFERALAQTPWKEYFSGGRKYYYHIESKESKWDMPDELLLLLEKVEKENKPNQQSANSHMVAPNFTPGSGGPVQMQGASVPMGGADPSSLQPQSLGLNGIDGAVGPHTGGIPPLPFTPSGVLPARPNLPDDPAIPHNGFATVEEAEKAFTHLLRKAGVDANWTWDQTMRAIITDPLYKALNTLAEKKAAWQKHTDGLRAREQEEREARLSKLRPALRNMLKGNPNVFHYTTFATADKLFAQHPIWQQAKVEAERKLVFEEYVAELKQREVQEGRALRVRSVSKVVNMFKQLNVDVLTRWRQAHAMLLDAEEWKADDELRKLPTLDILLAFEDYSRVREREFEEQTRRTQVQKTRKERKAREAFKDVLRGLVAEGKIKAKSKWKDVYPAFASDERYLNVLGNPGSNALELFWDVVDAMDQKLDAKVVVVEDAIRRYNQRVQPNGPEAEGDDKRDVKMEGAEDAPDGEKRKEGFVFTPETTEAEFAAVVKADDDKAAQRLTEEDLKEIFDFLHAEAVKKQEADKRRAERKLRHMQDDLRYALKKLSAPIDPSMSYEEAVPIMEHLPEYKALEDEGRRVAFTKFIKRQKERLREREASEDGGSTTSRKRKEPSTKDHREHEKERERDRERDYPRGDRDRYDRDDGVRSSRNHHRAHDAEYDGKRTDRDYDRDRDYVREPKDRDRDRDRDRDSYRSRGYREYEPRERGAERAARAKEKGREERRSSRGERLEKPVDDLPYAVVHEGGYTPREKVRERTKSVLDEGERSEKRVKYDPEPAPEAPAEAPPAPSVREETPEEGEI